MSRLRPALLLLLIVCLYGIVGAMDYQDAKREHAKYCEMVAAGYWPDFENRYERGLCNARAGFTPGRCEFAPDSPSAAIRR